MRLEVGRGDNDFGEVGAVLLILEALYFRCSKSLRFALMLSSLRARNSAFPPAILEGEPEWKIDVSPGSMFIELPTTQYEEPDDDSSVEPTATDR